MGSLREYARTIDRAGTKEVEKVSNSKSLSLRDYAKAQGRITSTPIERVSVSLPKMPEVAKYVYQAPAPKTAEEREADINRREANRSVQYSMRPEVRAAAIERAEAAGDTEKVRELSHAKDIESWAEQQLNSSAVRDAAQRAHDEALRAAIMRGDENAAAQAMEAGEAYKNIYKNIYKNMAQKTREGVYNYRQDEKRSELENVSNLPDFSEKAKAGATSLSEKGNKESDLVLEFINSEENRNRYKMLEEQYGEKLDFVERAKVLTDEEKNIIRYYAANGQYDKMNEYYDVLKRELNKRVQDKANKEIYEEAYKNPAKGTVQNVTASFTTPGAYAANAGNVIANLFRDEYVPTDTNSTLFAGAHTAKETNKGVTDKAYDAAGGGTKGEIMSFLAGAGLSLANYASKIPLGPTGAMIAMAADTAGQTTLDVLERGGTAEQALFLATSAGVIEALTEKLPLDNLFKTAKSVGKTGLKEVIKAAAKQGGMEATEEIVSELANTVLDIAVMRDKSEYQSYIAELEKSGMSRAEAEKEAFFQFFGTNVLMAGVGGAISGGIMGGGASAISAINTASNRAKAGGGFTETEFSKAITNKQIRALRSIGKALGVNIQIGAPTGDGKGAANGYYQNGTIVIAQDAKNPLEVVLCHEITHHMKLTAPAEYNAFLELAINASEKLSGVEKSELINRYKTEYSEGTQTEYSDAKALDEITADFASRLVNDISLFNDLANSNRNVAQRFIDSLKDFIAKVKSTFSGDKAKADTASQDKYGASVAELETAVAQFEKMISVTESAVASGNINTAGTDADGGRMFSLNENILSELDVWLSLSNEERKQSKGRFFFGRTSDALKSIGIPDYKIYWDKSSLAKKVEQHKELTPNIVKELPLSIENPIMVLQSETVPDSVTIWGVKDDAKRPVMVAMKLNPQKKTGEIIDYAIITSAYSRPVSQLQNFINKKENILYISPNKKRTDNWLQSLGLQLPPLDHQYGSIREVTFSNTIIPDSPEKSNRQNSLKTADLLSPDYGKDNPSVGDADTSLYTREASGEAGESDIKGTGLDTYFDEAHERSQVTQDKRIADANASVLAKPNTNKKTLPEKVKESVSFVKRKMVNSGEAIRKIAKTVKDKHLYGAYNRARSAMNIVSDMLKNKQTNIRGQKVGESLEGIIAPIKAKGEEYWDNFQLYLLHKHNVARMSLKDTRAEALAQTELELFIKENPDVAAMGEMELQRRSEWEDDRGLRARQYLELRENLNKIQNTKNKPIFFDNDEIPINADESRKAAAELLRKNPDFAEHEAKVRTYLDNLMQYRVDSGLITQEEADYFRKKYPDYVPTYRNTESVQKQMQGKTNIGTTVGIAKGGNAPVLPLDVALAEMTKKVVRSGQKNIFANKVFDLYDKNSQLLSGYITDAKEGRREIEAEIDSFGEEQNLDNTVRFHNNGKSIELTVTPELFEAFDSLSRVPKEQIAAEQWWRKVNDVYKKLITTYDPTFIIRNGFKDFFDGVFQSKDAGAFIKNYGRAYSEIANGGEMWELYQAAGGLYSSRFEELQNEGITDKKGKLAKIKEKLAFANMLVEQAPRLAEFMSVYEKGDPNSADTLSDALLAAAEVTTNFGESGTLGKVLNAYYIPFLNPAIQGTAKVVRTFTESKTSKEWIGLAVKCTLYGLGAGFLNDLINGDDEDYENLPDRTKDNYFLIPAGDGKFIKLPKGRVMAALGVVADRVRDTMKGEKVDAREAFSRIAENILPENPLNNNIFKAWFDADLFNEESRGRTWYGTDIENETLQSLPAGERYDNSTDYVSKALGKALGVSPKKLNYILQQYTGGVGRMVLPMITPKEQRGDSVVGKIGYGLWGILTSNFSTDAKLSNKISGEFYDAVDAAEQKKNSAKGTLADKVVYKHLNRERNMVGTYSSKVRAAEIDDNLTSKERQAAVRVASAERTEYQKTILENIDEYREKVEKYLKEYPGKDEEKKLEYAYREANRALYGEEYAIRVNGGSAVHKKAEEKVKRGKTTWKKYYDEYFGKTDRRYDAISDRFGISYSDFEKIEEAISKNSSKSDEIAAIQKLGYKNSIARRIYTLYHDAE